MLQQASNNYFTLSTNFIDLKLISTTFHYHLLSTILYVNFIVTGKVQIRTFHCNYYFPFLLYRRKRLSGSYQIVLFQILQNEWVLHFNCIRSLVVKSISSVTNFYFLSIFFQVPTNVILFCTKTFGTKNQKHNTYKLF